MAQATHNQAVTRTEIVKVTPATITLELSMEEASALLAVCRYVSGSPTCSRRKQTANILSALREAGVDTGDEDIYGDIYFKVLA